MMIQRYNIGAHGRHTVYAICYDTGRKDNVYDELARFDTLETATNVLRYIRGDILTREQIADAVQAIRKIDEKEGA
ncbi:MAG: hypothetical protein IJL23_02985 [Alphaproteobacteria bacterium]|nr:hypothetical protein [Alphaproteobacteria bacterium]